MSAAVAALPFEASDLAQLELYLLRRMREFAPGEHASSATGSGQDLVGLRDWQPGDPVSSVDWAQSSLSNFSPLASRQFEEHRSATVMALVDVSRSTGCGLAGRRIAALVSRTLAVFGFSAAFFQDAFGFVAFDDTLRCAGSERARSGRHHVLHCLQRWQSAADSANDPDPDPAHADALATVSAALRRNGFVPVISDFLVADIDGLLARLARVATQHDVLLVQVDARFAYRLPASAAGWFEVYDVESGRLQVLSRREVAVLAARVADWQASVARAAAARGLDLVCVDPDPARAVDALSTLFAARRVRKVKL